MQYKIHKANVAFHDMNRLWLDNTKINTKTKVRMYDACVKSILLENIAPLALTNLNMEKLSAVHRRHLRFLAKIFHPRHITNEALYRITSSHDIRIDIINCRWKFFGHILRRPNDLPAKKVMETYFEPRPQGTKKFKGKLPTSLPTLLHQDLTYIGLKLKNLEDLRKQEKLAQEKSKWKEQTKAIIDIHKNIWKKKRDKLLAKKRSIAKAIITTLTTNNTRIKLLLHKPIILKIKKRKRKIELNNGINLTWTQLESEEEYRRENKRRRKLEEQHKRSLESQEPEEEPNNKRRRMGEFAVTFTDITPQNFLW
jgi:hypothetical protein